MYIALNPKHNSRHNTNPWVNFNSPRIPSSGSQLTSEQHQQKQQSPSQYRIEEKNNRMKRKTLLIKTHFNVGWCLNNKHITHSNSYMPFNWLFIFNISQRHRTAFHSFGKNIQTFCTKLVGWVAHCEEFLDKYKEGLSWGAGKLGYQPPYHYHSGDLGAI